MTSERGPRARRPDIGLADLLRALDGLDAGAPGVAESIGRSLGFGDVRAASAGTPRRGFEERHAPEREPRTQRRAPRTEPTGAPPLPPARPELPPTALRSRLALLPARERADAAPPDLGAAPPLPDGGPEPPFRALFDRRTAPALLATAVATRTPGTEPDMPRILDSLGRLRWLEVLPTLPRPGLERGVDLLLDGGEGMRWLMDDLRALSRQLRDVVGGARCRVFSFRGDPRRARRRRRGRPAEDWAPIAGRPVLVATRFGAEPPPAQRDAVPWQRWRQFALRCRRAGAPLVALLPQRPADWPERLAPLFVPVHWDHRTRASTVRNAVGPGHRVDG